MPDQDEWEQYAVKKKQTSKPVVDEWEQFAVKKKAPSKPVVEPSIPLVDISSHGAETQEPTPTPSQSEEKPVDEIGSLKSLRSTVNRPVNQVPVGEDVFVDDANDVKVKDKAKVDYGNQLNSISTKYNIPKVDVEKIIDRIPDYGNVPVQAGLKDISKWYKTYKENPVLFERQIADKSNSVAIAKGVAENNLAQLPPDAANRDYTAQQLGVRQANEYNHLNDVNDNDLVQVQQNVSGQINIINSSLDGKERDKALANLQKAKAISFTPHSPQMMKMYDESELKDKLSPVQFAALTEMETFNPKQANEYKKIIGMKVVPEYELNQEAGIGKDGFELGKVSEKESDKTIKQRLGQETVLKKLNDMGRQNQFEYLSQQYHAANASGDANGAESYRLTLNKAISDSQNDKGQFPLSTELETSDKVKELTQQSDMNPLEYGVYKFAKGIEKGVEGAVDVGTSLVGADDEAFKAEKIGEQSQEQHIEYMPSSLRMQQEGMIMDFDNKTKRQVSEIQKDPLLSDAEKTSQIRTLAENNGQWVTNPDKGKNANVWSKATAYSAMGMLGDVAAFAATSSVLGAAGVGSMLSTSAPLFTSAYSDAYNQAVTEGMSNPNEYATVHAAIPALIGLVGQPLERIKAALGTESKLGQVVAGMTEKEWDSIVAKESPLIQKFKAAAGNTAKEAAVITGTWGVGASVASDVADNAFFNKNKDAGEIFDDAIDAGKHAFISSLGLLGMGAVTSFAKGTTASPYNKAMLWEIGDTPDIASQKIDDAHAAGTITASQAETYKATVKEVSSLIDKVPKLDANDKYYTDEQRSTVLYNLYLKNKAKETKGVSPSGNEKADLVIAKADQANDLILYPKTFKQLESLKSDYEKQLEEKDEQGKLVLQDIHRTEVQGQLEAVNEEIAKNEKQGASLTNVKEKPVTDETIKPETNTEKLKAADGQEYANTPRMKGLIEKGDRIRESLPEIKGGHTRMWRGNRGGEMGENPSFTTSLEGIALPFEEQYKGGLSYVDVPTRDMQKYKTGAGTTDAEYMLPKEFAEKAVKINETNSKNNTENKQGSQPTEEESKPVEGIDEVKPIAEEGNVTGITHAETDAVAKELGLNTYEKNPETVAQWDAEADKRLMDNPKTIGNLLTKLNDGKLPTEVEQRIMMKYMASLKAKIDKSPTNELLSEYKRAKELSDVIGGREVAKSLVARKGLIPVEDNLADYMVREMESSGVGELTDAQKEQANKEYTDIKEANEKYKLKIEELESAKSKNAAVKSVKEQKSSTTKTKQKSHDEYVKEREHIAAILRDKLKKARSETNVTIVPYAKELIAISPEVAKLVRSYVEEGIDKLEDIVDNLRPVLKDLIPDSTDRDIHDLIAGGYSEKKPRNELAIQLKDLRTQAGLVNKLDALVNGEEPVSNKKKIVRNQEIQKLRKQIKDFERAKADAAKEPVEKKTPEQVALASLKTRMANQIKQLEDDLKTGNFLKEPAKKEPLKLDKEALDAKDRLIKLKQQREIRLLKQQYANRSKWEKFKDGFMEVLNAPRSIMSSMDFSAPLRQGLIPTIAHPTVAAKAAVEMFKQAVSQKRFDRWFHDLRETPQFKIMEESGLYVSDPHNIALSVKEEAFMNNLAEKIPIAGRFIKGSERAYVSYLNKMRVDLFAKGADVLESSGKTIENSKKDYEALANWINNSTGRGKMPEKIETAAPLLNGIFFSPRLIASRLNLLTNWANPSWYKNTPKEVRVMYMKDMLKFVAFGTVVLALAKLNGAEVEDDPRSSDFGKIKTGDTRYDIWGGFQQYIRVFTQLVSGERKSATSGEIQKLDGEGKFGANRSTQATSFFRGKLAPIPSVAWDVLSGRTVTGDKPTLANESENHLLPLIYSDVKDAAKSQGVKALLTVGIPATFGVGVQTYLPKEQENQGVGHHGGGKGSNNKGHKR